MKKPVFAIFFIFTSLCVFICALTGCSMPIGSIQGGGGNRLDPSSSDSMWLVPRRQIYNIDELFNRGLVSGEGWDFQIFFLDNGAVKEIKPDAPGVTVIIYHNMTPDSPLEPNPIKSFCQFVRTGTHQVYVTYQERDARYSLEVLSPNNGSGIGGDGGIGIIWAD